MRHVKVTPDTTSPRKRKLSAAERKHFLSKYNAADRVDPPPHAAHLEEQCRILKVARASGNGYSVIGFRKGQKVFVVSCHTLSLRHFQLDGEPIPHGNVARHKCDRTNCSEETHLELGSHAENYADRLRMAKWREENVN